MPRPGSAVPPLTNLAPGLYWTSDSGGSGQVTFSFNTGLSGANTTKYNLFHVLPESSARLGPVPSGSGVVPYRSGPAAGRAVYDTSTGLSWPLDANLPADDTFGVTGTTLVASKVNRSQMNVPLVDKDGTVYFSAVASTSAADGWIAAMNGAGYAGTDMWTLPSLGDLQTLDKDLGLRAGDVRLESSTPVGPFTHLQPGFYWACVRAAGVATGGACDLGRHAQPGRGTNTTLDWSFNFDDGFEGTDLDSKQFYVMVYFPAPHA